MVDVHRNILKAVIHAAQDDADDFYAKHKRAANPAKDDLGAKSWIGVKKEVAGLIGDLIDGEHYASLYDLYLAAFEYFTETLAGTYKDSIDTQNGKGEP